MFPALLFFLTIAFAILNLLWFLMNFRIICSSCVKHVMDDFKGVALNPKIFVSSMTILTILIPPIQSWDILLFL